MPVGGQPLAVITNVDRPPLSPSSKLIPTRDMTRIAFSPRGANTTRTAKAIRCFLRVRPPLEDGECLQICGPSEVLLKCRRSDLNADGDATSGDMDGLTGRSFNFDAVFGPSAGQEEVYSQVAKEAVQDVFDGYHGLIFAYGQTGSGKTYTLCNHQPGFEGVLVRGVRDIFRRIAASGSDKYTVSMQMVQLYQETFQDLLGPDCATIQLRDDPELENAVELVGASCFTIRTVEECLALYREGDKRRVTGATLMNEFSSRSHALFLLNVVQHDIDGRGTELKGRLILVDLAGSERQRKAGSTGQRLLEARHINTSLLVLGRVVHGLTELSSPHVPYRDSKLTRCLQYALSGNGKTTIIITVSPSTAHAEETASAILFGQRAMKVKHDAKVHRQVDYRTLAQRLQADLDALQVQGGDSVMLRKVADLEQLVTQLTASNQQLQQQVHQDTAVSHHTMTMSEADILDQEVRAMLMENEKLYRQLEMARRYCTSLCDQLDALDITGLQMRCATLQAQLDDCLSQLAQNCHRPSLTQVTVRTSTGLRGWCSNVLREMEQHCRMQILEAEDGQRKALLCEFLADRLNDDCEELKLRMSMPMSDAKDLLHEPPQYGGRCSTTAGWAQALAEREAALQCREKWLADRETAQTQQAERSQVLLQERMHLLQQREEELMKCMADLNAKQKEMAAAEAERAAEEERLQSRLVNLEARGKCMTSTPSNSPNCKSSAGASGAAGSRSLTARESALRAKERDLAERERSLIAKGRDLSAHELDVQTRLREVTAREKAVAARSRSISRQQRDVNSPRRPSIVAGHLEEQLQERLDEQLGSKLDKKLRPLQERVAAADREAKAARQQLEALQAEYGSVKTTCSDTCRRLREELDTRCASVDQVKAEFLATQNALLAQRETAATAVENRLKAWEDDLNRRQTEHALSSARECAMAENDGRLHSREAALAAGEARLLEGLHQVAQREKRIAASEAELLQIIEREGKVSMRERAVQNKEQTLTEQERLLAGRQQEIIALQSEIRMRLEELETKEAAVEQQKQELDHLMELARGEAEGYQTDELVALQDRAEAAENEVQEVYQKLADLQDEYDAMKNTCDDACRQLMKADRVQQQNKDLRLQLEEAIGHAQRLEDALRSNQQLKEQREGDVAKDAMANAAMTAELQKVTKSNERLQKEVATLQNQLKQVKTQMEEDDTQITAMAGAMEELRTANEQLEKTISTLRSQQAKAEDEVRAAQHALQQCQQECSARDLAIADLQGQVEEQDALLQSMAAYNQEIINRQSIGPVRKSEVLKNFDELLDEHTKLQEQVLLLQQQNTLLQSRQSTGSVRKSFVMENFDNLLKEHSALQEDLEAAQRRVAELERLVRKLESPVATSRSSVRSISAPDGRHSPAPHSNTHQVPTTIPKMVPTTSASVMRASPHDGYFRSHSPAAMSTSRVQGYTPTPISSGPWLTSGHAQPTHQSSAWTTSAPSISRSRSRG